MDIDPPGRRHEGRLIISFTHFKLRNTLSVAVDVLAHVYDLLR